MASAAAGTTGILRNLGRLFRNGSAAGLGEAELLDRFVRSGDEAAFEALVERHGPMVLGVCRRVLGDSHAADDAFQATFLVMVRRARSIRDGDRLGPWLYGVAQRVARRARSERFRRQNRERGSGDMAGIEPAGGSNPARHDHPFAAALDDELERLPRAYRDVIVLCDLESRTHEEAARLLRWPIGTVKGRLQRARERLRSRLQGRGLVLPAAGLAALLGQEAKAVVPAALVEGTVRAATVLAAGGSIAGAGLVSASAIGLADGVITTMVWTPIKMTAAVMVAAGTVASASVWGGQEAGDQPGKAANTQVKHQEGAADRVQLARAKLAKAQKALDNLPFEAAFQLLGNSTQVQAIEELSLKLMAKQINPRQPWDRQRSIEPLQAHHERMERVDRRMKELSELLGAGGAHSNGSGSGMMSMMSAGGMMGAAGSGAQPVMDGGIQILAEQVRPAEAEYVLARAELWLAEAEAGQEPEGLLETLAKLGTTRLGLAVGTGGGDPLMPSNSVPSPDMPPPTQPGPGAPPAIPGGMPLSTTTPGSDARTELTPNPLPPPQPGPGAEAITGGVLPAPTVPEPAVEGSGADPAAASMHTYMGMMGSGSPPPTLADGSAATSRSLDARNAPILEALDRVVDLEIPEQTPLSEALKLVNERAKSEKLPDGLPIFLDASGYVQQVKKEIEEANKTPSPGGFGGSGASEPELSEALNELRGRLVSFELKQVPLKTSLRLLLKQAGLGYLVKEGVVYVGVSGSDSLTEEAASGAVPGYGVMPLEPRGRFSSGGQQVTPSGSGSLPQY